MKHYPNSLSLLTGVASVLVAINPAMAANIQVTGVEIQPKGNNFQLTLKTTGSSENETPQMFTVSRGKELIADVLNTQLNLPEGDSFRQQNPIQGINSVEVVQLDGNSIRLIVEGENNSPTSELLTQNSQEITLSFTPQNTSVMNTQVEETPITGNNNTSEPVVVAQAPSNNPNRPAPQPDVLFPNPTIIIDGRPAPTANPIQPVAPVPPFLPRAVAPPVGDIAVSNIDSSAQYLDLGTAARVPRLVLREAPVQEVLNLLARAADLNVVYTAGGEAGFSPNITLDLENESVQDVFNSVLIVSGLQATRRGRTIFIGSQLPPQARDLVTRSFRLNQVKVEEADTFLANMTEEEGLLDGLRVVTDPRLNAITLIGEPRQIAIASNFLVQLDARQRQVAVNVKIVDVNLLNTENVNTSFSFGIGDNFFSVNNGALAGNFGLFAPAPGASSGGISPPFFNNPLLGVDTFLDLNSTTGAIPRTGIDQINIFDDQVSGVLARTLIEGADLSFFNRVPAISGNPFEIGITDITRGTPEKLTTTLTQTTFTDAAGNESIRLERSSSFQEGTEGDITQSVPSLLRYPNNFLASLNTQITNGSAKILTDPTLVIQNGQTANVNLTQEVFGGFELRREVVENVSTTVQQPIIKQAGLQLRIDVEGIDDNGFITLQVNPTVSAPGNEIPTEQGPITLVQSRTLQSGSVRMRDGQTLILAGIIQESDRASVTKVPILGDIPILGALFRSSSTTNQRNEVIVLVTPQIIDDSEQAGWGYNYIPGTEVRGMLENRGFYVPTPNF
jgi:type IV pilus assembly protein PilQ